MITVTLLLGTLLAALVAGVVLFDARGIGLDPPPAWAIGVGTVSFACFVVGEAMTLPIWFATVGSAYVTSPWYLVLVGTGVGALLTLLVIAVYGIGTRRAVVRSSNGVL